MKAPDKLLRHLERRDVAELALISGRLPCVKVGTAFDPVDNEARLVRPRLDEGPGVGIGRRALNRRGVATARPVAGEGPTDRR